MIIRMVQQQAQLVRFSFSPTLKVCKGPLRTADDDLQPVDIFTEWYSSRKKSPNNTRILWYNIKSLCICCIKFENSSRTFTTSLRHVLHHQTVQLFSPQKKRIDFHSPSIDRAHSAFLGSLKKSSSNCLPRWWDVQEPHLLVRIRKAWHLKMEHTVDGRNSASTSCRW